MSPLPRRGSYRIAPAEPAQLGALTAIELAAAAQFAVEDLSAEQAAQTTPLADFAEAQADGRLWVALADEQPVGFALVTIVDGCGHLDELDVHPDHGRRGLGTQLLRRALRWRRFRGLPCLTLTTFDHVAWNRPFYERRGFEKLESPKPGSELERILSAEMRSGLRQRVAMIHRGEIG